MTTRTTRRQLPRPYGICDECYTGQKHHPADQRGDVYFCDHNGVMAIPKSDWTGWFCESGIDRAEFRRRTENAAKTLQSYMTRTKKLN